MIILARVKSATAEFIKILRFGKSDVQTSPQHLPAGIDSKPINGMLAAQAETASKGETIVFGYQIISDKTKQGEIRIFATDTEGVEVFDLLLKNDGTAEFGGNTDNLVRYLKLNQGLQAFTTDLNAKLVTAFTAIGGTWPGTSIDISESKIDEIKSL